METCLPGTEGCRSLETCLPGQRGCRSLETCLPGQRGVEATRDLQFAREEGCGSLETFSLPGKRGV